MHGAVSLVLLLRGIVLLHAAASAQYRCQALMRFVTGCVRCRMRMGTTANCFRCQLAAADCGELHCRDYSQFLYLIVHL